MRVGCEGTWLRARDVGDAGNDNRQFMERVRSEHEGFICRLIRIVRGESIRGEGRRLLGEVSQSQTQHYWMGDHASVSPT